MNVYEINIVTDKKDEIASEDDVCISDYTHVDYVVYKSIFIGQGGFQDFRYTSEMTENLMDNFMKYGGHCKIETDKIYLIDLDYTGANKIHILLKQKLLERMRERKIDEIFDGGLY